MPKTKITTLNKKEREEIKENIIEEINNDIKPVIVNKIVEDIKSSINDEYKEEIKENIKSEIKDDIKKSLEKEEKKLSRKKSFKIMRLYIYLLLVVACAFFMIYRLYITDNLNVINEKLEVTKNTTSEVIPVTTTNKVVDLKEKYAYLLDNIKIDNIDIVKSSINIEELTLEEKLRIVANNITNINEDGSIYTIEENEVESLYHEIFMDDNYEGTSFQAYNLDFVYSNEKKAYLAIGERKDPLFIQNYITDIKEENDEIIITAKVYLLKDNNITGVFYNTKVAEYKEDIDMDSIKNRLKSVEYHFKKYNDNYYLNNIIKK